MSEKNHLQNSVYKTNRPWWDMRPGYQLGGSPFETLGTVYCNHCKMETDVDTDAVSNAGIYAYRRRCLRCGNIIQKGAYAAPLVCGDKPMPSAVFEWVTETGRDRR